MPVTTVIAHFIGIVLATSVTHWSLVNLYTYLSAPLSIFGPEKTDRLTKEKPSDEDMKKMAPCMDPGKTKPKPKDKKGPKVY